MVRGVYAKDSSAASANVMARERPLEYQLQAELNVARTTRTEHGVSVAGGGIGGGTRTTELPGEALGWTSGSGNQSEVPAVEQIEELHAELCAIPFPEFPNLSH